MQKLVSIIMGVYNGANTLGEAIESLKRQTYKNWELIVCDDCSTDSTISILEEYSTMDVRIKMIQNECNLGLAASLNHCIKYAKGNFIARMDCDDISDPLRLEKQVRYLEKHTECDLVGTYMKEFEGKKYGRVVETKINPTKFDLPKGAPFAHATILVRSEVLKDLKGYCISDHTVRTEDVDLWYRFFAAGFVGANIPEPLYYVRMDEAAYKRRKFRYMLHASYIIWYGCDLVELPWYYKIYCIKPILSWIFPRKIKIYLRKFLVN